LPEELAARMATWGRGRADITEDDDQDPVAIPDLWGIRWQSALTQAGTLRHHHPAALAIRQETQILHANRERTRPPRELAWALAMYVYAIETPPAARVDSPMLARGRALFDAHCRNCHANPTHGGEPMPAERVGTDPALAFGSARGTGMYRPSPLVRVAEAAPYLHHGVVASLEELLSPDRFAEDYDRGARGPGPIPGHTWGTALSPADRAALLVHLRSL
jgi:cytochrome c5